MNRPLLLLGALVCLLGLGWFFSYRILDSPLGLTADEAGFGINATYLARTLRDENKVFLPVFALSLGGKEWRQPVTQYYTAIFFKIFGASVPSLRYSTVPLTLFCAVITFLLAREIFGYKWALFSTLAFIFTPLVMIQTHMALDNIMVLPFTLLWLLFIAKHRNSPKVKYLFWAGVSLGIGFYSYKAMRATVPVWCILTVLYLAAQKKWREIGIFALGTAPFFLVIPFLERRYPGAVFDNKGFTWSSWYDLLLPFISSFDLSFLFITGDATPWHSTGKHGMLLLATFPLFIIGLYKAVTEKKFSWFVLAAFFTAPLLFGFVNSIHRASRLMSMIPPYVLIVTWGARAVWKSQKMLFCILLILMFLNFGDFVNFYWYKYPELTRQWFGDLTEYKDFESLAHQSKSLDLQPYIDYDISPSLDPARQFYEVAYLGDSARYLAVDEQLPTGSILMSNRDQIPGLTKQALPTVKYRLLVLQ